MGNLELCRRRGGFEDGEQGIGRPGRVADGVFPIIC